MDSQRKCSPREFELGHFSLFLSLSFFLLWSTGVHKCMYVCVHTRELVCAIVLLWQTIYIFKIIASKRSKVAGRRCCFFFVFGSCMHNFISCCWMCAVRTHSASVVVFNFTLGGIIIYIWCGYSWRCVKNVWNRMCGYIWRSK